MSDEKISFEEAFKKLQENEARISEEGISLEDSIKAYKEGLKNYKICADILKNAAQKIELID
jgi:exodeoxyribonuclease VII small subunit